ncbi:MAG: hypothetical protein K2G88_04280 [Oscillospiraceae bacterium]|nr:hypothetical protein [Oscillospiraceae bacterium]
MRFLKRVLAGVSAFAMITSPTMLGCFTAIAEEITTTQTETTASSETTTESDTTTSSDNGEVVTDPTGATTEPTEESGETSETSKTTTAETTTEATTEATTEPPTKDTSAPWLGVNIPQGWKKNTSEWNMATSDEAVIYYVISDDESIEDEEYNAAQIWNGEESVPEGDKYIRFWAAYDDADRQIASSKIWHYQIDRTKPSDFVIKTEVIWPDDHSSKRFLKVFNENEIIEELSKISVYYIINDGEVISDGIEIEDGDGHYSFSFTLDESLNDADIVVYVEDEAGNVNFASTEGTDFDSQCPEISSVSVVDKDGKEINPHAFGDSEELLEDHPYTSYLYANDDAFLKVVVTDDAESYERLQLILEVNEEELAQSFAVKDLSLPDSFHNEDGVYYIPLNHEVLALTEGKIYNIGVKVTDELLNYTSTNAVSLNNAILYDPATEGYQPITISEDGNIKHIDDNYDAYFGAVEEGDQNSISISLQDDIGIASYSISVNGPNGQKNITTDLSEGIEKIGTYTVTTVVETEVTDSEGNTSTETTVVTETKEQPYREVALKPVYDDGESAFMFLFDTDGVYTVNITIVDLAGNISEESRTYSVDTTAPIIDTDINGSFSYSIEQGLLRYFTFGIFGKETVTLSITITDGGSGMDSNAVVLHWAPEISGDLTEYNVVKIEGNKFIFAELPIVDGLLSATPYITISDRMGNESIYYFRNEHRKLNHADADNLGTATLVLETYPPHFSITANGSNYKVIDNKLYFGDTDDSTIEFAFSDNVGIDYYSINIENQDKVMDVSDTLSDLSAPVTSEAVTIEIDAIDTGEYPLNVLVRDLSGFEITEADSTSFDTSKIYIDKTAPTITNTEYTVVDSVLKYFTFGIFGNTTISISVDVSDNEFGSGVQEVSLYWAKPDSSELVKYSPSKVDGNKYTFDGLNPDAEAVPHIVVEDLMGNNATYYFITVDSGSEERQISQLILDDESTRISLVLEDDAPITLVSVPDSYTKFTVNGEMWYPGDVEYTVSVVDSNSGLNKITIAENENTIEEVSANGKDFISYRYTDSAEYTYSLTAADNYTISVTAEDNAGNVSDPNVLNLHIDKEDPQIVEFQFGGNPDAGTDYRRETYGFYFMVDTEVRVYVNDPGNSSGIKSVRLWLEGVQGSKSENNTVDGTNLIDDSGRTYASFTIPMGFKGQVYAEVVDNVYSEALGDAHTSSIVNADGNIIENAEIHSSAASIEIVADVETDKTDAANVPLYNRNIPLTITVKDTFSGISTIEWSIANDGESGTISVANDGTINAGEVSIGNTESESNLVTLIQFALSVDNNSNGNVVTIKLTDRSGNTSESTKTYSIDTTVPTIEASFGNTSVQNGSYYKDAQIVNITITERNFDGSEVQITLNGAIQTVSWDDDGSTVGQDGTAHHASFNITADGDYIYEIRYTDRAGNEGATVTSSQFTIDAIPPTVEITFDIGDDKTDNVYYKDPRNATFTVTEHNYSSASITITKDGSDVSSNYSLDNWTPKDHSGDNHSQTVGLNESGYYQVAISVVDKAGNTFQTTSKKFYIDLAAPEVNITVDNVGNGEPSNEKTITPFVSISDAEGNLDADSITLKITTVKLNEDLEIVPDTQILTGLDEWENTEIGTVEVDSEGNPNNITFSLNNLEDDGIYTFEVVASDFAGNAGGVTEEEKDNGTKYKLSVNRLGSTYEVDSQITDVDPDLRYYRNNDDQPFSFTIKEYNVNTLNSAETIVKMTCDGTVVDNDVTAVEDTGTDKWSIYTYEFPSEVMTDSGKYIVKLYSVDAAGNENPLEVNGDDERATVTFFIDNINPEAYFRDADDKTEFTNEDPYRTNSKRVEVEVYDNSQQEAHDVVFKLNGEELTAEHDVGTMVYTLEIPSKTSAQSLSVSLEDIAGNKMDTGVDNFLITTNILILWFKNTPLFVGSIVGLLAIVAGIIFDITRKKNKTRF